MIKIASSSILSQLQMECFFTKAIAETEDVPGSIFPVLKHKIGHICADYDGYRWWNTPWPLHPELETPEICAEIDKVYEALTGKTAFCNLTALTSFCKAHPDACVGSEYRNEYNFYFEGERCNYWIRLITRQKDYNLYLNAFVKGN